MLFLSSQLTVIVSASQGILFGGSQSHFETLQQNASGYESIEHQLKMHINDADLGRKNVSGNAFIQQGIKGGTPWHFTHFFYLPSILAFQFFFLLSKIYITKHV